MRRSVVDRQHSERSGCRHAILYEFLAVAVADEPVVVEVILALASCACGYALRVHRQLVVEHIGFGVAVGTLRVVGIEHGWRRKVAVAYDDARPVVESDGACAPHIVGVGFLS